MWKNEERKPQGIPERPGTPTTHVNQPGFGNAPSNSPQAAPLQSRPTASAPRGNASIGQTVTVKDAVSTTLLGNYTALQPLSATNVTADHMIYGYTMGLGVDIKLAGGLFMRAEWEYVRFVDQVETNVNTVRAGLGYKF